MPVKTEYSAALMALLRSALWNDPLTDEERGWITAETLPKIASLAKMHDMDHLLPVALRNHDLLPETVPQLEKSMFLAVFRCQRQEEALARVCHALEEGGIPFLPLKGAILRKAYPESWMRTSCDIDILVRPEDLARAAKLLESCCGCIPGGSTPHDISFQMPNKTQLELHHSLMGADELPQTACVLETVWNRAILCPGKQFHYAMPDDLFYFYHLAHMAKHMVIGGCGIRPFLDLWLLERQEGADREKRDLLLEQGGLLTFARVARRLAEGWFGKAPMDSVTLQLESFLFRGGVYGTTQTRVAVQRQKQGGWLPYLLSRIFLPMPKLKIQFPILHRYPWLMPVMQVCRWCKRLLGGYGRKAALELTHSHRISEKSEENIRDMLENIGL